MNVLIGDIGGTKTILQLYQKKQLTNQLVFSKRYDSQKYVSFYDMIKDFLEQQTLHNKVIDSCCLGIAGPVSKSENAQIAQVTNLPWEISDANTAKLLNCKSHQVSLINDFVAVGLGVNQLENKDLVSVQQAKTNPEGNILVLGAGTGLGVAQLIWLNGTYQIQPSEAGHALFAPANKTETALLSFLIKADPYISNETLLSGNGIKRIYDFILTQEEGKQKHGEEFCNANEISKAALKGEPACVATLHLFASIYGSIAGDLALFNLPFGGIFLAGGIAPKNLKFMTNHLFVEAFNQKGKMSNLMKSFSINIVTNEHVGLLGALKKTDSLNLN